MDNSVIRTKDLCDRCSFRIDRCNARHQSCGGCENFNGKRRFCNCIMVKENTPCDFFKEEKDD